MKRISKLLYVLAGLVLIAYALASYYLMFWGMVPSWLSPYRFTVLVLIGIALTVLIGLFLFAKGLFSRRRLPALFSEQEDGGSVYVTQKALRNITYITIERFEGILEDRVRVRVLAGKPASYRVKIWLGIAEYSELPARHDAIRQAVADALYRCTGVKASRVDLVFYTARTKDAHNIPADTAEGGQSA